MKRTWFDRWGWILFAIPAAVVGLWLNVQWIRWAAG